MQQDVFKYHSIVHKLYYAVMVFLTITCFIIIRIKLEENGLNENLVKNTFKIVLAISVPLSIALRLFFIVRPRIFASYVLGEHKILQRFKNRIKEIEISKIDSVKLSLLPPRLLGGFKIQLKTGQKFVFLSLLENNFIIFEKIIKSRPELMSDKKAHNYILNAKRVKSSWKRAVSRMKIWQLTLAKYLLLPFILCFTVFREKHKVLDDLSIVENIVLYLTVIYLLIIALQFFISLVEDKWLLLFENKSHANGLENTLISKLSFYLSQALFFIFSVGFVYIFLQ
ncbi:MAG: hypothetical protein KDD40_07050 [Bdellovibrionales bacterium]|nr:hypothetical protein [Bdellovibrionales bacterium]